MKDFVRDFIKHRFWFWLWSDSFFEEFYSANCIWIENDFVCNDYCENILTAKYYRFMKDYLDEVMSCQD